MKMKVKIEGGLFGFGSERGDECVRLILFVNDIEVTVGPYTVNAQFAPMPDGGGLFVCTPRGERYWRWDEVRAWFTRKPLTPPSAA